MLNRAVITLTLELALHAGASQTLMRLESLGVPIIL